MKLYFYLYTTIVIIILIINFINCINVGEDDKQLLLLDSPYREREPIALEQVLFGDVNVGRSINQSTTTKSCKRIELDINWESQLATTISNTPTIVELFGVTNEKYIIVTNSHSYIDIINGMDGDRLFGWPYILPDSSFAASPLVYDIDGDSNLDVMVTTTDAEILFIHSNGLAILDKTLKVPPLKVKKYWYEGIVGKHVDASFSLYDRDNKKFQIQKQIQEQQQIEDQLKKEYQQGIGKDGSKVSTLIQTTDKEYDPLYSLSYDRYLQDNKWFSKKDDSYIWLDSHILSTPVIADIDGDGINELVCAVSYFYDSERYANPIHKAKLDADVSVENYIAGGISVFNLATGEIKWQTHLDLTTDKTDFKGSVYGSPTVVDLNGDGKMEIIIGTALGFLYVLDYTGNPLSGNYPLVLDSIFTQVVTEDLDSDGKLELIVLDTKGNVVCFSSDGDEIWSNMIHGKTEFPAAIGDLNGDGILDVVLSTSSTGIYAWDGKTGTSLPGYPIKFESSIISPLLLLDLPSSFGVGMTIFVHSSDGILYAINGRDKCISRLDIGDFSITKILVNDLTGDGNSNLLLSTYDQKLYCLSVPGVALNPLTIENSYPIAGGNKFTSYSKTVPMGVTITSRSLDDISGSKFIFEFLILDHQFQNKSKKHPQQYTITIYFGQSRLHKEIYSTVGVKKIEIEIPQHLSRSETNSLTVEMRNLNGQTFKDSISVSFNFYFYRLLKFLIIVPILISSILLLVSTRSQNLKPKNKNML